MLSNTMRPQIKTFILSVALLPCPLFSGVEFSSNKKGSDDGVFVSVCVRPVTTTQTYCAPQVFTFVRTVFSSLRAHTIQKHSSFTTSQWDNFFSNMAGQSVHLLHQVDRNDLFCQFNLYQFPSFRAYIATLEGYHEAMVGLNNQIMQDKTLAKNLDNVFIARRSSVKDFISKEAEQSKQVLAMRHQERVRVQQAAIAKQREAIAQQVTATIQAQKKDLTAIVDTARSIEKAQSPNEKAIMNRAYVIEKTIDENFASRTQKYTVLSVANPLLQALDLDADNFKQCHGNALQQHIHDEFVTNVNRASLLNERHGHISGVRHIAESAVEFAHVGMAYNNAGHVKQAMAISNLVSALNDYGWAVVQGVGDGVVNTVRTLSHPIDIVLNIGHATEAVIYHLGKVLYEVCDITGTYLLDPIAGQDKIYAYEKPIKAIYREIYEKYQSISGPEIVRGTIAFGTEAYLTAKCLDVSGKFYAKAQAKVVEFTKKIEQGLATAPKLLASAEGFEVLVAGEAAETVMLSAQENAGVAGARKVSTTLKTMHEPIAWHELDPALGDLTKIKEAESLLKSIDAADPSKHPLAILVKTGQKNATSGNLGTARGALYELEVAAQLEAKGEKVSKFGEYLGNGKASRDFDISTQSKLIECKNWNWEQVNVTDIRSKLQQQKLIADHLKKSYAVYSKGPIPENWKTWFIEKNIIFHEGTI